ncbi:uncharacterized protein LOC132760531 [Ruditapes philippinarum]|uniref:uncharacterized protein LOC132760531 n=1 Tax=Ruditapes philippinarum TaxID=129788 RepID=UPI00295AFC9B|nr:uncharacterized protein LOC132760531 [Ruditapes philippinarum]
MFSPTDHTRSVSLQLSKVLDDIGVNYDMVRKRRQTVMAEESLRTVMRNLQDRKLTTYNFGSRTEGTTTAGLHADSDTLACNNQFNIIQDLSEWRHGYTNLLMVRDANTPPGYCLLQRTYDNFPHPVDYPPSEDFYVDSRSRVLMKNDWFVKTLPHGSVRRGPSQSIQGLPGFADDDLVHAFYCKSWPREARILTETASAGNWPSEELKRQAMNDGCFVVPVGCRGTENEELQWRISTSLTERRLMFSLNIVQIRCYVLMKMILKSYQILDSQDALSSFICKTVLLHCIEKGEENLWQDDNLINCLNTCLKFLHDCVLLEHCPHFLIPENNLMARRISPDIKPQILAIIQNILRSDGKALEDIEIDHLGMRITGRIVHIHCKLLSPLKYKPDISGHLLYTFMSRLSYGICGYLTELTHLQTENVVQKLSVSINKLTTFHNEGTEYEQKACELISNFLYMSLGSVLASNSISKNETIQRNSLVMLEQGSANDISSTLKWASVFYCKGDMPQTISILDTILEQYSIESLQSVCCCYQSRDKGERKHEFEEVCVEGDIKHVLKHTAFCVRFLPCEVNCVPEELKHEYFRPNMDALHKDYWMDWAVVDSIPYYYFLLYKVQKIQGNMERQQAAFDKLRRAIDSDSNLGHKETDLNLLAQCMEQEGMLDDARDCYTASTDLRPVHNAANSLISQIFYRRYSNNR